MDKNHRDRIAFVRICSGKFERGMDAFHVQGDRKLKLATGTSMMADDRAIVDEAYAGDIVGLFDPGIFSIGDTRVLRQAPRAVSADPDVCARDVRSHHAGRHAQAQAVRQGHGGARPGGRHPDLPRVGCRHGERHRGRGRRAAVRGTRARLKASTVWRFVASRCPTRTSAGSQNDPDTIDIPGLSLTRDTLRVEDMRGGKLLLFTSPWNVDWATEHNPDLMPVGVWQRSLLTHRRGGPAGLPRRLLA